MPFFWRAASTLRLSSQSEFNMLKMISHPDKPGIPNDRLSQSKHLLTLIEPEDANIFNASNAYAGIPPFFGTTQPPDSK